MDMETITWNVPDISCHHCIKTIEREIGALEGVSSVKAELESRQVTVSFGPPATAESIKKAMAEIGYPAAGQVGLD
ncbi:MAG: heavy-metal-associated domain-containing protein [Anaerolineae bacterium]